jgi:peptide/nickel transport system ATP-binding protein
MTRRNKSSGGDRTYLGARDARKISRENARAIRPLERQQNRKSAPEREYKTSMHNPANIAEIAHLHAWFYTDTGIVKAVDDVSFAIPRGKTVCIVGESGCGKSVTCLAMMQLLPRPIGQIVVGEIRLTAKDAVYDVVKMPQAEMQRLRGKDVAIIFQEPMTCLNPVLRVGYQIDEAIMQHNPHMTREQVRARTLELLSLVEIPNGGGVYQMYPHELSGGMRQRVMIALALSCNPRLIIADEPTTALDVTIQAQILALLQSLKDKLGVSILFVTHDLGVVASIADVVLVMYAGRIVERGTAEEVFLHPAHPYTIGLMRARPVSGQAQGRLYSIPGAVPNPIALPDHCYFRDRCARRDSRCEGRYPQETTLAGTHLVCCHYGADREADA